MIQSPKELLIAFSPDKCNQCTACQIACKAWRGLPYGINNRRVITIWDGDDYPKTKYSSLSLSCLHCVEPFCAEVCPGQAIEKRADNGLVEVNRDLCIGCHACFEACPYDVPQFDEDETMVKCDLCLNQHTAENQPPCVATCPGDALGVLFLSPDEKLIYQEKISKLLQNLK